MLSLESQRWAELEHAYGTASDIPHLLAQLANFPGVKGEEEPWFSLWSALAHQGDVYSASFAAVPHVIAALARAPLKADSTYFQFPAWVEICRRKRNVEIPADLEFDYFAALSRLPALVADAAGREWDASFLQCALSAIAVAKGQTTIAESILELSPKVANEFIVWCSER